MGFCHAQNGPLRPEQAGPEQVGILDDTATRNSRPARGTLLHR